MCISSVLAMLNNSLIDSPAMKYTVYAILLLFIGWSFNIAYKYHSKFYQGSVAWFLLFVIANILISPYDPLYPRIIKFIGYVSCFAIGYIIQERGLSLKYNKFLLYTLILLPVFLVTFFDHTAHKTVFFVLSNTYSYFGLTCALFIMTIKGESKSIYWWSASLLGLYIISCSTLGIVAAIFGSIMMLNYRNVTLLLVSAIFFIIVSLLVVYSNISVFVRIRDVINLTLSLSWYDWTHLKDMDFYEITRNVDMESNRTDNGSFLWRLSYWMKILDYYIDNWYYAIIFGLGDGFVQKKLGLLCHNEYIKILTENGIIVFGIVINWIVKVHEILRKQHVYYLILAAFVYHFTENLIDTFVANALFYFCIGFNCCKYQQAQGKKAICLR